MKKVLFAFFLTISGTVAAQKAETFTPKELENPITQTHFHHTSKRIIRIKNYCLLVDKETLRILTSPSDEKPIRIFPRIDEKELHSFNTKQMYIKTPAVRKTTAGDIILDILDTWLFNSYTEYSTIDK